MLEQIKKDLLEARKSNHPKKSILQVLVGEIQLIDSRRAGGIDEDEMVAIVKKLKKSCDETFEKSGSCDAKFESLVLAEYLPKVATKEEISVALHNSPLIVEIFGAENPAKFIGKANEYLKSRGIVAEGKDVAEVVRNIGK